MFFQTSLESGLGSWILRLVDLVWIPPWPGPASLVILSVWGALGTGCGEYGEGNTAHCQLPRGLLPNCSKPYRLGGISNTISVHCFLLVIKRRPVPCCGSSQLLWWERGVGGRHDLGFICLAAGSPLPLGHSAASQGRAAAGPSVAAAAGEHGLGLAAPPCTCVSQGILEIPASPFAG